MVVAEIASNNREKAGTQALCKPATRYATKEIGLMLDHLHHPPRTISRPSMIGLALASSLALGCQTQEQMIPDDMPVPTLAEELRAALADRDVTPVTPPPVQEPAQVELGQKLFFDKELSGNRNISCATCHSPLLGSADAQTLPRGQGATGFGPTRVHGAQSQFLPRNSIEIWNRGVPGWDIMFWDGRLFGNLEDGYESPAGAQTPQTFDNALAAFVIIPLTPPEEMRGFPGEVDVFGQPNELADLAGDDFTTMWSLLVDRVMAIPEYRDLFAAAFPDVGPEDVDIVHLSNAMGAFMTEGFTALDSPFDRFLAGDDAALSDRQKRGALLFYGRASCSSCHQGGLQTDFDFHNIAVPQVGGGKGDEAPFDFGRGRETGLESDRFRFRTPSLRNVELSGPWLHNGAFADLEDVVRHHLDPATSLQQYSEDNLDPEVRGHFQNDAESIAALLDNVAPQLAPAEPLDDDDIADLMAFLSALTDPASLNLLELIPHRVPSGLPVAD